MSECVSMNRLKIYTDGAHKWLCNEQINRQDTVFTLMMYMIECVSINRLKIYIDGAHKWLCNEQMNRLNTVFTLMVYMSECVSMNRLKIYTDGVHDWVCFNEQTEDLHWWCTWVSAFQWTHWRFTLMVYMSECISMNRLKIYTDGVHK